VLLVIAVLAGLEAWRASAAEKTALDSKQHAEKSATAAQESEQQAKAAQKTETQVQRIARHTSDPSSRPQRSLLLAVYSATLQPHDAVGLLGAIDGVRQQLRIAAGLPLDGQAVDVVAATYSPDQRWLAVGRADGLIRLHDLTAADPRTAVHDLVGKRRHVALVAGRRGLARRRASDLGERSGTDPRARREPRWAVARLRHRVGSDVPLALAARRTGGSAV
jgi:hypothetical protein